MTSCIVVLSAVAGVKEATSALTDGGYIYMLVIVPY